MTPAAPVRTAGVAWHRAPTLVRGLDYYRHTAFEFVTDRLGAQGTVLGGGRYDGLIETLGGPHTPAVGWAAGIERLAMLVGEAPEPLLTAILAIEDDEALEFGTRALAALRNAGLSADMIASGSPRKRFDKATKVNAYALAAISMDEGQPSVRVHAATATPQYEQVKQVLESLLK